VPIPATVSAFSGASEDDPFGAQHLWDRLRTGAPVLKDTLASLDCRLDQIINIGTHSLFVGQVVDVRIGTRKRGLVYFDRVFRGVEA